MEHAKQTIAHKLAEAHYALEPGIARIIRLLAGSAREDDPAEPVKLLEVNEDTIADGIRPVFFGARPDKGIPCASVIIEVTPDEYEQIRANPSMLPNNWRLGEELARAAAPVAGR